MNTQRWGRLSLCQETQASTDTSIVSVSQSAPGNTAWLLLFVHTHKRTSVDFPHLQSCWDFDSTKSDTRYAGKRCKEQCYHFLLSTIVVTSRGRCPCIWPLFLLSAFCSDCLTGTWAPRPSSAPGLSSWFVPSPALAAESPHWSPPVVSATPPLKTQINTSSFSTL